MAWPSSSPRARLVRRLRWRMAQLRDDTQAWFAHVIELDRAQRQAFHGKIRSLLDLV